MGLGLRRVIVTTYLASLLYAVSLTEESHAQTLQISEPPAAPPPSLWHAEWPTFSKVEGAATLAAGVGTGVLFMLKTPKDPRWQGGVLFDDAVRNDLRLHSASARQRVRSLGDLPYFTAPLVPLLIDPLVACWLLRDDTKAAVNLELVGLEAFSYAGLLSYVSTRLSVRERPDSAQCRRDNPAPGACASDTESFYSGHTTIAAVSAGVVCANHRVMRLWGAPAADVSACALASTAAVASGLSRLAADRHYATDVLAGFGMGFGIGYAVPTLFHYARRDADVALSVAPGAPCTAACLRLEGSF